MSETILGLDSRPLVGDISEEDLKQHEEAEIQAKIWGEIADPRCIQLE